MKIIGKTNDGFILDATRNEIANLIGFYFGGSADCPEIKVGTEIKIWEMYKRLYDFRSLRREFNQTADRLESFANALREHSPIDEVNLDVSTKI